MTDYMGSRLPSELINFIYSFLSAHDMTCMARTSRRLIEITVPFLYRNVVLTRRNASALFYGLPRQPAPKKRYPTKAAWNDAHDKFKAEFAGVIGRISDDGAGDWSWTTPAPYDMEGSDPETDDEGLDPPHSDSGHKKKDPFPAHDAGDLVAWWRKKALLSYCHFLAIVQAPPTGLCRDLLMNISDVVIDNSVSQSVPTVRQLGMSRYMKRNESPTKYRAHTTLFPNLAHLSIGSRAVHSLSESDDIARLERHPFFSLLPLLGKPVRACVACPPAEGPPAYNSEYIFRRLRNERDTTLGQVNTAVRDAIDHGFEVRAQRACRIVGAVLASVRTVVVHNIRYTMWPATLPIIPDIEPRAYRYEYTPALTEWPARRARLVCAMLAETARVPQYDYHC